MLIASVKSWSARGASHQPAFMSTCLTISHTCLLYLPTGRKSLFWSDLFVVGRVVIWERSESSELRSWVRCTRVVRRQGGKGGRVARWQSGRFLVYLRMKDKIMFHCFREVKYKQGFTTGTWYYLWNCLGVTVNMCISGLMVRALNFTRGGGYELTFQFFWGF